jgi:predicted translin family RNA/ssDNA-binding protein
MNARTLSQQRLLDERDNLRDKVKNLTSQLETVSADISDATISDAMGKAEKLEAIVCECVATLQFIHQSYSTIEARLDNILNEAREILADRIVENLEQFLDEQWGKGNASNK